MIKNLLSDKPDPRFSSNLELFGQFIGDWKIHSTWFLPNNKIVEGDGEVSFGWILYGSAIQDVWTGKANNPPDNFPKKGFGTTLRFYNPTMGLWNCVWIDPISSVIMTFTAQKKGEEIILEGTNRKGEMENWIYSNIHPNSFTWRAEISKDKGKTWILEQKIVGTKIK